MKTMQREDILAVSHGLSPADVCAELLALGVVEFSRTPTLKITLELNGAKGRLSDTGRGMRLTPDRGDTLTHAERALTGFYPCLPSSPAIEAVLGELVWGERGSLGPSVANFACSSLQFTSMRDGEIWSQRYCFGKPLGPAVMQGTTQTTGTVIDFETAAPIDGGAVEQLVEKLCSRIKGLSITLSISEDSASK